MRGARSFDDKVVVIRGAAGGTGSARACAFGRAGARVLLLDLDASDACERAGG
jgi:NAD(P)-dependent dehydrogenase (short-subunit alcohol dehydrogenase family)